MPASAFWEFGSAGSGFYATVSFDGTDFTVTCEEGAFDLNALWFSDGDGSRDEGDISLPKADKALSMDGTKVKWDDVAKLSSPGSKVEKLNSSKSTFLAAGEDKTYSLSKLESKGLDTTWITDWSTIILGLRATSVYGVDGTTSIKYTALPSEPPDDLPDYITVGREGMWFDTNEDGVRDEDEPLFDTNGPDTDGYYTINDDEFVGFADGDYTVRFVDAITPKPLDLTGFGAGDKLIIDGKTNCADWYGVKAEISGLAGKVVPTYIPTTTRFDFGIYPGLKNASGYIYNTSSDTVNDPTFVYGFYAYLSQRDSKVRGIASSYQASPASTTHPLAKGLPTSDPWPSYSIEVIQPLGGSLFAP